MADKCH